MNTSGNVRYALQLLEINKKSYQGLGAALQRWEKELQAESARLESMKDEVKVWTDEVMVIEECVALKHKANAERKQLLARDQQENQSSSNRVHPGVIDYLRPGSIFGSDASPVGVQHRLSVVVVPSRPLTTRPVLIIAASKLVVMLLGCAFWVRATIQGPLLMLSKALRRVTERSPQLVRLKHRSLRAICTRLRKTKLFHLTIWWPPPRAMWTNLVRVLLQTMELRKK